MTARLWAALAAILLGALVVAGPAAAAPAPASTAAQATAGAVRASGEAAESVQGTLRGPDREPIEGVTITVTQDGADIGSATTDADGKWSVPVTGPGSYTVTLDVAGLPEGVAPRAEGGEVLEGVNVRPGASQGVIFQLGTGEVESGGGGLPVGRVLQLVVDGIKFGAIIAITAVGLSLVFGTTKLINFAHGEFVTIGAVAAYFLSTSPGNIPIVIAAVLAMAVGGAVAGGFEVGLWRPLRKRGAGLIQMFIVAIGLSLLLRHLVLIIFGSRRQQYDEFSLQTAWTLGPVRITPRDLVITILAFAIMIAVAVMLQRTRIGTAMRAVNDNRDLAEASGIDVQRVVLVVWVLGVPWPPSAASSSG